MIVASPATSFDTASRFAGKRTAAAAIAFSTTGRNAMLCDRQRVTLARQREQQVERLRHVDGCGFDPAQRLGDRRGQVAA